MDSGIVGLGRMGGNMARRLTRSGVRVVGFDPDPRVRAALAAEGTIEAADTAIALALMSRFDSQGKADFVHQMLAMMRTGSGGHPVNGGGGSA